jgi:hypothetical protein
VSGELTVPDLLARNTREYGGVPALVYDVRSLPDADVVAASRELASGLGAAGVG